MTANVKVLCSKILDLATLVSAENLAWLRQTGRRYIIGAPKSELQKFGAELARADGWRVVQEGVEVKLARHPESDETVILCRSADRRNKERAMHHRFSRRIADAPERLSARIARSKKRLDPATVNRQIGRILQPAAARFAIALKPDGCPAGFRLQVDHNEECQMGRGLASSDGSCRGLGPAGVSSRLGICNGLIASLVRQQAKSAGGFGTTNGVPCGDAKKTITE